MNPPPFEPPPPPSSSPPPPVPFGDPTRVRAENSASVRKGLFFGCGGCLLVALAVVALAAGVISIVFGAMSNSDVCKEALARAKGSRQVQAALGTPIEKGWFLTGSIAINGDRGDADVWIPISGPDDSASIHAVAKKEDGHWDFKVLTVTIEKTGRKVDLLPGPTI